MNCTKQIDVRAVDRHCSVLPGIRFLGFLLALCCAFLLIGNSYKVSAVEPVSAVLGSALIAYAAVCGISFVANNLSLSNNPSVSILDDFNKFLDKIDSTITAVELTAQLIFNNGHLQLNNTLTSIFDSYFIDKSDNGIILPLDISHKYTFSDGTLVTDVSQLGGSSNIDYKNFLNKLPVLNLNTIYYINNIPLKLTQEGTAYRLTFGERSTLMSYTQDSNNTYSIYTSIHESKLRGFIRSNSGVAPYGGMSINYLPISNGTLSMSSENLTLPSLNENELIDISIPNTDVQDINEFQEVINDQVISNTLDVSHSYKTPELPPVPTGYGFIDSINGIWKYVVHLFNEAAAGISFLGDCLSVFPTQITWCFFGGLVLLIFAGVISKLLQ